MAIIESEVRSTGRDAGVAAMFEAISSKIEKVAENAKMTSVFSNLSKEFTLAESKLKALERLSSSKVQSDINVKTDGTFKVEITAAPGIEARQTFQNQITRISTGPSMPDAVAAPHVARRDE